MNHRSCIDKLSVGDKFVLQGCGTFEVYWVNGAAFDPYLGYSYVTYDYVGVLKARYTTTTRRLLEPDITKIIKAPRQGVAVEK